VATMCCSTAPRTLGTVDGSSSDFLDERPLSEQNSAPRRAAAGGKRPSAYVGSGVDVGSLRAQISRGWLGRGLAAGFRRVAPGSHTPGRGSPVAVVGQLLLPTRERLPTSSMPQLKAARQLRRLQACESAGGGIKRRARWTPSTDSASSARAPSGGAAPPFAAATHRAGRARHAHLAVQHPPVARASTAAILLTA
jgi:hypothetical protein